MNWIYRLNWWYDDLDKEHGVLRFMLFIVPMGLFSIMMNNPWHNGVVALTGVIGFALFAILRLIPFAYPRKRQS